MPLWVALSFITYAVSGGYFAGMMEADPSNLDKATALGFAVVGLLAPVERLKRATGPETAVSPVIRVVLMVAITVVLAGAVFYLVSSLADDNTEKPVNLLFQGHDNGSNWDYTLIQAPKGLDWSRFTVQGCTTVPTGSVDAGDQLLGCTQPTTVVDGANNRIAWTSGAA